MMMHSKNPASIALISLLVIASISLLLVVAFTNITLNGLTQANNQEVSTLTYYYAEACLEESISRLEEDLSYVSGTLSFDEGSCSIVVSGSSPILVDISASFGSTTQNFQAELDYSSSGEVNNFTLLNWGEIN